MSSINNINGSNPIAKITPPQPRKTEAPAATPAKADRVELSGAVQSYLKVLKANDIRTDKVADIKSRIEAGTYETDDKLDAAADKLLDELLRD